MSSTFFASVLLVVFVSHTSAYPVFLRYIPNGNRVPNPCNLSTIWLGVGHQNIDGGDTRNAFGLEFKENEFLWNRTLCEKDSDGDGRTNGQELGDPDCIWTEGSIPTFSTNLSHPGICEPIGSQMCVSRNSWLMNCMPRRLDCPAAKHPDVRNYTLRFPVTSVPSEYTTYIYHRFTFPRDAEYDIIAIEPVIDNAEVLHHMLLFACNSEPKGVPVNESYVCGMRDSASCPSLLATWTSGYPGQCLNSQYGFRIGPVGFQYAILQLHWTNKWLKTDLMDSSGMMIHYTPRLRPHRGQVSVIGQIFLDIPPGREEVTVTGSCISACTSLLPRSVFITTALLHMHLIGKSGDIRHYRNGTLFRTLANISHYEFNSPQLIEFENPIELIPGDEIRVTCVYQSTQRDTITHFGESMTDEMCFGVFTYYPLYPGFDFCGSFGELHLCNGHHNFYFKSCNADKFFRNFFLLGDACKETCWAKNCSEVLHNIFATGCQNYWEVNGLIQVINHNDYLLFLRCASEGHRDLRPQIRVLPKS